MSERCDACTWFDQSAPTAVPGLGMCKQPTYVAVFSNGMVVRPADCCDSFELVDATPIDER